MRRIGEQIKFQQIRDFVQRQINLNLTSKKIQPQKLQMLQTKIKQLDTCLKKIRQKLVGDKRFNQGDVRLKINNYNQEIRQLKRKIQQISLKYQKQQLIKIPSNTSDKNHNYKEMYQQLYQQKNRIQGKFEQTGNTIEQTNAVFHEQTKQTKAFLNQIGDAQVELDIMSQFMRTISNRNLLTKIILVLLILFLGLADLIIFILKIT